MDIGTLAITAGTLFGLISVLVETAKSAVRTARSLNEEN